MGMEKKKKDKKADDKSEDSEMEENKEPGKEEEPDLLTEIKNFIQEDPKSPSTPRASVRLRNRVKNDVLKQLTGEDEVKKLKKKEEIEEKKKPILLRKKKPKEDPPPKEQDPPKENLNGDTKPKISLRCEDTLKKDVRISLPINNIKPKINLGPDISIKKIKKRILDDDKPDDAKKAKVDESHVLRILKKSLTRKEVRKVEFKDNFDRYFSTSERFCEHNDSISESSDDEIDGLLSHFVYLNKPKEEEEKSVHDLVKENPSWSVHSQADGSFTLAKLRMSPDEIPTISKMVVFDCEFNIKVYVDNKFLENYKGVYDSYESMRDLINEIDEM